MICYCTALRMAKKKKPITTPNAGENLEEMDHSHSVENGTINLRNILAIS